MIKQLLNLGLALILTSSIYAQQGVAINNTGAKPATGSILDISSNSAGVLIPRMTEAERNGISPVTQSMLIYQTNNDSGFYFYDGSAWMPLLSGGAGANSGWRTKGNSGTDPNTSFIGTADAQDWVIRTNNSERVRVLSGGNIGIGTQAPSGKLTVSDATLPFLDVNSYGLSSNNVFGAYVRLRGARGTEASPSAVVSGDRLGAYNFQGHNGSAFAVASAFIEARAAENFTTTSNGTNLVFHTADMGTILGKPKMTIEADGNIGIGTQAPTGKLTVSDETLPFLDVNSYGLSSNPVFGAFIRLRAARGSEASPSAIMSGDRLGAYNFQGHNGSAFAVASAFIDARAAENFTTSRNGTNLIFYTASMGTILGRERMRITANGNVGIGTTNPTATLCVNGNIRGNFIGSCSDERYKKNFQPISNTLKAIKNIDGLYYYWKTKKFEELDFSKERQIGFIAQEVEKYFPEVVMTDRDGYKSVDYSKLTPVLFQAIKEQQQIIDELKADNKKMKKNNTNLQEKLSSTDQRLEKLESLMGVKASR